MADDTLEFGACCACRQTGPTVRNLIALEVAAPVPGTGWGCVECGAPSNGAVAVLCDACVETGAPILDVCDGYPVSGQRVPRETCTTPFTHDMTKHPEEQEGHVKPEDIRQLYHDEEAATEEEAAQTREEVTTDPEQARNFLKTIYALSTEDPEFALLLRLFLEGMLMRQIEERAAQDDAYALDCAKLITGLMGGLKPPRKTKPPRGRQNRTAKTA